MDEAGLLHRRQQQVIVLVAGQPNRHPELDRQAARQGRDGAEVDDNHPAVGQQHEVARVGVAVQHPQSARRVEGEFQEPGADHVALFGGSVADDFGHRHALDPLLDHHLGRAGYDARHREMRVIRIRLGELALVIGLQPIVELHLGALDQFVHDALDVGAG